MLHLLDLLAVRAAASIVATVITRALLYGTFVNLKLRERAWLKRAERLARGVDVRLVAIRRQIDRALVRTARAARTALLLLELVVGVINEPKTIVGAIVILVSSAGLVVVDTLIGNVRRVGLVVGDKLVLDDHAITI